MLFRFPEYSGKSKFPSNKFGRGEFGGRHSSSSSKFFSHLLPKII